MDRFIADIHFGGKYVMAYDNRPFSTVEENDEVTISNWNEVVNIDDTTYILGDISDYNVTKTIEVLKQLNGNKVLVVGNHDKKFLRNKIFRDCFINIADYMELDIENDKKLILSHYPIPCFNNQFRGSYHFYGHVHTSQQWNMIEYLKRIQEEQRGEGTCNMYNVGCMMPWMSYVPRTFAEIVDGYNKYNKEGN